MAISSSGIFLQKLTRAAEKQLFKLTSCCGADCAVDGDVDGGDVADGAQLQANVGRDVVELSDAESLADAELQVKSQVYIQRPQQNTSWRHKPHF